MADSEALVYQTPEEISQLPVIGGGEETDGGSYLASGYVYLIWENGTNYFKVGRTGTPSKRLSDLQTGNPRRLDMAPS